MGQVLSQGPLPARLCCSQGPTDGHSPHQERVPLLMDKDGVHAHEQGALLVVLCQVVLPQGHTVGQGVAEQRRGPVRATSVPLRPMG